MSLIAFSLIVVSAVLHASWNLIAKKNHMRIALYATLCIPGCLIWSNVQFWTPVPVFDLPLEFWLTMVGTVVISDVFIYCIGLTYTYKKMDMASAYPMMRALPILMTAGVTTLLGWGEPLPWISIVGFVLVFCGSLLMPLKSFSDFKLSNYMTPTIFFVFYTALGTTGYTIFDSHALQILRDYCAANGIDVSKPIISMTYYSTRSLCLTATMFSLVLCLKDERAAVKQYWKERNFMPLVGGFCASGTYVLVLIAMNYVTNVSYVQVCRQLGLPIGMAAGIIFLKERSAPVKWIGVGLILVGFAIAVLCK
ncbi:MAG: hypothetical protein E7040_07090 [Lentisphaerae bacterium]|nr:hypothetical protein [Lentisphaerota bacterium]